MTHPRSVSVVTLPNDLPALYDDAPMTIVEGRKFGLLKAKSKVVFSSWRHFDVAFLVFFFGVL